MISKEFFLRYTLQFSNETHSNKFWFDIVVDLPPKFESLQAYRVTLGHKANHSFRNNAMYTLYTAHPVLGTVMSIIAKEDIKAGDEVTTDYHYPPEIYKALNITLGDNECSQVWLGFIYINNKWNNKNHFYFDRENVQRLSKMMRNQLQQNYHNFWFSKSVWHCWLLTYLPHPNWDK